MSRAVSDLQLRALDAVAEGAPPALAFSSVTGRILIGRSEESDWRVRDPVISRRHASLRSEDGAFFLRDLDSRHGTHVNGTRLLEGEEVELRRGDIITLGSWRCIVDGKRTVTSMHTIMDNSDRIQKLEQSALSGLAQVKLDRLLHAARSFSETKTRGEVGEALIRAVRDLRGCQRTHVVREIGEDEFEVLASSAPSEELQLSRSLVHEAREGQVAQLLAGSARDTRSHSLIELDIQTALCAPVMVGGRADCFLYIDSRGGEDRIEKDASTFCHAVTGVAGMAIERMLSAEMEARRRQIESDLKAARDAQRLLFPPASGGADRIGYVFESIPGRFVGGDLFDFMVTDRGSAAFFLGDATGKGVGAGMHMVATQTQLRTLLSRGVGLAEAMNETNAGLMSRSNVGQFITLIAGVFDPASSVLELCDAGHGFSLIRKGTQNPEWLRIAGSVPLGVDDAVRYASVRIEIDEPMRLVLVSDGVVEQTCPSGEQFGIERALETLGAASGSAEEVRSLVDAVKTYADGSLSDDLSVASIGFRTS
ncbi:MAG: FHA domain-containing protein [Phycisphaera sp.]|nr:MAG: FHA domain-containing protein [Phycisphaera sp.]